MSEPTSEKLITLARKWRRGEVINIGPGLTAIYFEIQELEDRLSRIQTIASEDINEYC